MVIEHSNPFKRDSGYRHPDKKDGENIYTLGPSWPLICEECGREGGVVSELSYKRTYCVHVVKSDLCPYRMLCQWCRGKEKR